MKQCLFPFALLYDGVTRCRNALFDCGWLEEHTFAIPTICVGNLAVGGTGKTPHVEMIVGWLLDTGIKTAVLSRGYGRKTHGFRLLTAGDSAESVGDEPLQIFRRFKQQGNVSAVCEDRVKGIKRLTEICPQPEAIVLDDAYQHRYVKPGLNILLTEYGRPFDRDFLLPMGRLREAARGARRADVIIVTKCPPTLPECERQQFITRLKCRDNQAVFFSTVEYSAFPPTTDAGLVTGIAHPAPLLQHLQAAGVAVEHLAFSDHHRFTAADREAIIQLADRHPFLFTTEKDSTRLELLQLPPQVQSKINAIPIATRVLFDEATTLRQIITDHVTTNSSRCSVD